MFSKLEIPYKFMTLILIHFSLTTYLFFQNQVFNRNYQSIYLNLLFHKKEKPKMRIFDTWMYNSESEFAYIRMWRLYDYVDYFIIMISELTFSGLPNNISFAPFEKDIEPYKDKIHIFSKPRKICYRHAYHGIKSRWCRENSQRDYSLIIMREKFNLTSNDLVLVSDVDEIFTREAMRYIIKNPPKTYYYIKGAMYFPYYFHKVEDWNRAFVYRYDENNHHLAKLRLIFNSENLIKGEHEFITHCSYCFRTIEQYRRKLQSFSHQEFNKPPFITNDWIFRSHYCREKINSGRGIDENITDWSELIPNDPRLNYLIDPSFEYPLNMTSYKKEDLENMCDQKYKRTPLNKK